MNRNHEVIADVTEMSKMTDCQDANRDLLSNNSHTSQTGNVLILTNLSMFVCSHNDTIS